MSARGDKKKKIKMGEIFLTHSIWYLGELQIAKHVSCDCRKLSIGIRNEQEIVMIIERERAIHP